MIHLFKIFQTLLDNPSMAILICFLILVLIIIVYKAGIVEKDIVSLNLKFDNLKNTVNKIEEKVKENEVSELDIIDKYLQQKNNSESILDSKKINPIKADKIIRDGKISSMLDPRKKEEEKINEY